MVFSPVIDLRITPSALVTTGWQALSEYRRAAPSHHGAKRKHLNDGRRNRPLPRRTGPNRACERELSGLTDQRGGD
jgi:hypothetical protein